MLLGPLPNTWGITKPITTVKKKQWGGIETLQDPAGSLKFFSKKRCKEKENEAVRRKNRPLASTNWQWNTFAQTQAVSHNLEV